MADAKGREKVLQEKGATSYYPCVWCCQRATTVTHIGRKNTHHMMGIASNAIYTRLENEQDCECPPRMHGGDVLRPTDAQIRSTLDRIENEQQKCWNGERGDQLLRYTANAKYPWKGSPQVFKIVPTLNILDSCPLPVYHLLLLNIVKKFICYIFDGLKKGKTLASAENEDRGMKIRIPAAELQAVEGCIITTCDMKKPYCPVRKAYSWISEEVGAFVRVYSPFVFDSSVSRIQVLTPAAEEAWKHLRAFTMYYLGYTDRRDEAIQSLMAFGHMCEAESEQLMTSQLHTAICRLPQQEERLGRAYHQGEMWMERAMRLTKSTSNKIYMEETLAISILVREAIYKLMTNHRIIEPVGEYCPRKLVREHSSRDEGCISTEGFEYRLRGVGMELKVNYLSNLASGKGEDDKSKIAMGKCLKEAFQQYKQRPGNSKTKSTDLAIFQHKAMSISRRGFEEEVKSSRSKEKRRRSYYVETVYNRDRRIAEIVTFFKISRVRRGNKKIEEVIPWEDGDSLGVCRFAVVHIFNTRLEDGVFRVEDIDPETAYLEKFCVIPITDIIGKVYGALYLPNILYRSRSRRLRGETPDNAMAVFKPHQPHYVFS